MKKLYISLCAAVAALSLPVMASAQCTTASVISTVAGNHTKGYTGDGGPANEAQMRSPYAVATDAAGNVYIADYFNHAVRKVNTSGVITTIAGDGIAGYTGDGGPASAARLNGPAGITFDDAGNLYIADKFNERIRKIDATTGNISTVAGNGAHGGWNGAAFGNGGMATAAALTYPVATAFDGDGNMYIADNGSQTVRKIDATTGVITRFAGTHAGGFNGDGIAASTAKLNNPRGLAVDAIGNVYISDCWNNRIRKVDTFGQISTYAGTGTKGYAGDGGPATAANIFGPWGITLDECGNLYICDYDNYVVRKVNTSGTISTFAGNHLRGYTGDGGTPDSARVYLPSSLALDGSNNAYIADYGNLVVRIVGTTGFSGRAFNGGTTQEIHVCENSTGISIDNLMTVPDAVTDKTESWSVSAEPEFGTLSGFTTSVEAKGGMVAPKGLVYTPKKDFTGTDEFTVQMTDGNTTASTTITVYVDELPNPGAISAANVTRENSVSLTNPTGDAGGTWSSSDETIATVDANGNVTAVDNGIVTIAYTVTNNCGSKSANANVVSKVSDLKAGQVSAFPNPSAGTFRLDFASDKDQPMHLVATDVTGKVVYTADMQATTGINTWSISLPANIQRPSLVRVSVMDGSGRKLETITLSVIK